MDLSTVNTPLAGFVAGLVVSIHCVGMCGPLGCALLAGSGRSPGGSRQGAIASYHFARMLSYALIGAIAGAAGGVLSAFFSLGLTRYFPWVFAAVFVLFLLGWEKKLPPIPYVSGWFFRVRLRAASMNRVVTGSLLGAFTPLLPCAPLYLLFGAALFSGSALNGAALLAAFAIGTMAPMWFLQSQFVRLQTRFSPITLLRVQKGLATISIVLVLWRFYAGGELSAETGLPLPACCDIGAGAPDY